MTDELRPIDWRGEDGIGFFRGLILGLILAAPLWGLAAALMGWL